MIRRVSGKIISIEPKSCTIDVGTIALLVYSTDEILGKRKVGEEVSLWTHLVVKEDVLDLYGFETQDELILFKLVLGVSGIGPKTALSILSIASPEKLAGAISAEDISYLTKVSGIGKKNAEKIVIELRDKVGTDGKWSTWDEGADTDVIEALKTLGYAAHEARDALKSVDDTVTETQDRIKESLKYLSR